MPKTKAIMPTLRYHDARAAIHFLCRAFGFGVHLEVEGEGGTIAHAQLVDGDTLIMVGTARDDELGQHQKTARTLGGCSQSPYLVVDDFTAHYERAVAAGARVVIGPRDEDHGGSFYACLDPEGNLWNFGDYDPWA
jgi:uncharacterized glyoxalase superfamily protein PhnB